MRTCGNLACICGLCVRWWIMCTIVDFSFAFVDRPEDPLHALVDCVHECGSLTYIFRRI